MLPSQACETCTHYYCDAMGDYGSPPYEIGCRFYDNDPEGFKAKSGISDDPGDHEDFPFNDAPGCYEVEFWHTDFCNDLDGSEERLNEAYALFKAYLDEGTPL